MELRSAPCSLVPFCLISVKKSAVISPADSLLWNTVQGTGLSGSTASYYLYLTNSMLGATFQRAQVSEMIICRREEARPQWIITCHKIWAGCQQGERCKCSACIFLLFLVVTFRCKEVPKCCSAEAANHFCSRSQTCMTSLGQNVLRN